MKFRTQDGVDVTGDSISISDINMDHYKIDFHPKYKELFDSIKVHEVSGNFHLSAPINSFLFQEYNILYVDVRKHGFSGRSIFLTEFTLFERV